MYLIDRQPSNEERQPIARIPLISATKGKQPFFSYKVLQLREEKSRQVADISGGTHTSPRMHLRRGHLRRLENKTIWVKPAMVNASAQHGIVVKDYSVSKG